ncbi:MAG: hypothetical protein RJR37_01000 [Peptococcaceae bacterium MAG4]|nr:hypothetical protein [Peptococcaceae bacterium MAG4]HQD77079.1 hypothetical protein [Bacillota bacterium]
MHQNSESGYLQRVQKIPFTGNTTNYSANLDMKHGESTIQAL